MRGDIVYRVYGVQHGWGRAPFFGAFRTRAEAEAEIAALEARTMHGENWAARYHQAGFEVRETIVDTDFEIPSLPKPRDKWAVRVEDVSQGPDVWPSTRVEVCRRGDGGLEPVASYQRNYQFFTTFEPFRQGSRELALISRDYTATAVLDLATGEIVAEETPHSGGFCPVGFFVPDWWDVHGGNVIPGSEHWKADDEWPTGDFGFVWGCVWGDDGSWKLQYLDLTRVSEGIVTRDERFGYIELATHGWNPPWLDLERTNATPRSAPPQFLRVWKESGVAKLRMAAELRFELQSGQCDPWQIKCLTREENGPE